MNLTKLYPEENTQLLTLAVLSAHISSFQQWVVIGSYEPGTMAVAVPVKKRGFPGCPVVKNSSSNAGDADSIPGQGTKTPDQGTKPMHCTYCAHTLWSLHAAAEAGHSPINNKKKTKRKKTQSPTSMTSQSKKGERWARKQGDVKRQVKRG